MRLVTITLDEKTARDVLLAASNLTGTASRLAQNDIAVGTDYYSWKGRQWAKTASRMWQLMTKLREALWEASA